MKPLSLKLRESVFNEVEKVTHKMGIPRNSYINEALDFYNKLNKRRLLKRQLHQESESVSKNSLEVLREFERLEDVIE